jgi:NADPH2:quinone reductase
MPPVSGLRAGTLVCYSIASKRDDTGPVLLDFLKLLTKLAFWNYLPTNRHASFHNVWAGAGKPGSAKRHRFQDRTRADLTHLFGLLREGVLTARIAARFPLTEVTAAMELAESANRTALGKIILVP